MSGMMAGPESWGMAASGTNMKETKSTFKVGQGCQFSKSTPSDITPTPEPVGKVCHPNQHTTHCRSSLPQNSLDFPIPYILHSSDRTVDALEPSADWWVSISKPLNTIVDKFVSKCSMHSCVSAHEALLGAELLRTAKAIGGMEASRHAESLA